MLNFWFAPVLTWHLFLQETNAYYLAKMTLANGAADSRLIFYMPYLFLCQEKNLLLLQSKNNRLPESNLFSLWNSDIRIKKK
jgi:hypothetical protein